MLLKALSRSRESRGLQGIFWDGASRDRTGDLLLAKQALSHLSYGPAGASSLSALVRTSVQRGRSFVKVAAGPADTPTA